MCYEADTLVGVLWFSPGVPKAKLDEALKELKDAPHALHAGYSALVARRGCIKFVYQLGPVLAVTEQGKKDWIQSLEKNVRDRFFPDFICGEYGHDPVIHNRSRPFTTH